MTRKRRRRRRQRRDAQGRRVRGVPTGSPRGPRAPGRGRREAHPTGAGGERAAAPGVRGLGRRRRLTSRRPRASAESDATARRPCVTNVPPSSPGVTPRRQVGVGDGWSREPGRRCALLSLGGARVLAPAATRFALPLGCSESPVPLPPLPPRPQACTAVRTSLACGNPAKFNI